MFLLAISIQFCVKWLNDSTFCRIRASCCLLLAVGSDFWLLFWRCRPGEMTTIPGSPVWELVKKNNYFLIKQFGNNTKVQFSKEPNNLYNVHSYKFSGLANSKTVAVQPSAGEDKAVVLSTTKTKKQNTPAKLQHKTLMRKEFRKMAKSVKNQVLTPEFCT